MHTGLRIAIQACHSHCRGAPAPGSWASPLDCNFFLMSIEKKRKRAEHYYLYGLIFPY
jgi:hypothetical protein